NDWCGFFQLSLLFSVSLISYQPVEAFAAIISSLYVARPCQATACLRLGAMTHKMLFGNFFNRTIER
ncbi:hypothetical protein, partial [Ruminococcus sp.]|uniref:hypothetical protein n=1 Tax=Ruminococcus sp. TaxID=41978 RepID=UPI0025E763D8